MAGKPATLSHTPWSEEYTPAVMAEEELSGEGSAVDVPVRINGDDAALTSWLTMTAHRWLLLTWSKVPLLLLVSTPTPNI